MSDYEKTYTEFWKGIVENPDGTLNRDQVMRELHDYHLVMGEVSQAYCELTGDRISKPNTAALHVIAEVEERTQEAILDATAVVLHIVSAWCVEANDFGGVDAGDLAQRLEQAGHPLPDEEADDA